MNVDPEKRKQMVQGARFFLESLNSDAHSSL